jgi:hypothetical protein
VSGFDEPMHELILGSLDLIGRTPQGDDYTISALGDNASWGNPVPITTAIKGLLSSAGSSVTLTGWDNREVFLRVTITGTTGDGLAAGERALFAQLGRRNTLTWTPPGGFATASVFEVEFSEVDFEFDDKDEVALRRAFGVKFICRPFVRAAELTYSPVMSAPPPPVAPVIVTVDDCNSTTGWTSTPSPVAATGGYVYNSTRAEGGPNRYVSLSRAGSIDMSSTLYLVVEWRRDLGDGSAVWEPPLLNATAFTGPPGEPYWRSPLQTTILDESWAQSIWAFPSGGTLPQLIFAASLWGVARTDLHRLHIRNINRTDKIPSNGSPGHQLSRTINVEGSAPTTGTVHLWHDDADIGDVLIHTSSTRNGMFSLEPFKIDHTSTPSVGTVSGSTKSLTSTLKYWVPASLFDPDRATGYLLLGRLSREGTGVITIEARSLASNGVTLVTAGRVHTYTVSPPTLPTQTVLTMAAMHMPTHRVGDRGVVELKITLADPVGTPTLDDLWLVDVQTGALTWIDADKSQRHLWQEEPTVTSPLPRVRSALTNDGSTSMDVDATSYMPHRLNPGEMYVYSVSTAAPSSKLQIEYFKRDPFHSGG